MFSLICSSIKIKVVTCSTISTGWCGNLRGRFYKILILLSKCWENNNKFLIFLQCKLTFQELIHNQKKLIKLIYLTFLILKGYKNCPLIFSFTRCKILYILSSSYIYITSLLIKQHLQKFTSWCPPGQWPQYSRRDCSGDQQSVTGWRGRRCSHLSTTVWLEESLFPFLGPAENAKWRSNLR